MAKFPCSNPKCPNEWHRSPECPNLPISSRSTGSGASSQIVPPSVPNQEVEAAEMALEGVLELARTRCFHDSLSGLEVKHDSFSSRVKNDSDYDIAVSGKYRPWYDNRYGDVYAIVEDLSVRVKRDRSESVFEDEGDSFFTDLRNRMTEAVEERLENDPFHSQPKRRFIP